MRVMKAFSNRGFSRGLHKVGPQETLYKPESVPNIQTHQPEVSSTNIIPSLPTNDKLPHFKKQGYSKSILKHTLPLNEESVVVNEPKVQRWPRLSNYRNSVVRAIRTKWNKITGKATRSGSDRGSYQWRTFHSEKDIFIFSKMKPSCVKGTCRELIERKRIKDNMIKRLDLFAEALRGMD